MRYRVGGKFLIMMNVAVWRTFPTAESTSRSSATRAWFSRGARGTRAKAAASRCSSPNVRAVEPQITLEHVGLPDAEVRARHHEGWSCILAEQATLLASRATRR